MFVRSVRGVWMRDYRELRRGGVSTGDSLRERGETAGGGPLNKHRALMLHAFPFSSAHELPAHNIQTDDQMSKP